MDKQPWLTFSLEDTLYALPVKDIREVSPWSRPEPVPAARRWWKASLIPVGKSSLLLMPVYCLVCPATDADEDSRTMTLELPGETIGLTVDRVGEIAQLDERDIEQPHTPQAAIPATVQVDDELVVALDISYLRELSAKEGK